MPAAKHAPRGPPEAGKYRHANKKAALEGPKEDEDNQGERPGAEQWSPHPPCLPGPMAVALLAWRYTTEWKDAEGETALATVTSPRRPSTLAQRR